MKYKIAYLFAHLLFAGAFAAVYWVAWMLVQMVAA